MNDCIRIAGLAPESIVDGPGIRFTVFTQGCAHRCVGCHNPHTHDYSGGMLISIESLITKLRSNSLLDGVTLSGGEPFDQAETCSELASAAQKLGLDIWVFSGYTFEELLEDEKRCELLYYTNVLVDGKFIISEKTNDLKWRGSCNQRIINVPASIETESIVLYNE